MRIRRHQGIIKWSMTDEDYIGRLNRAFRRANILSGTDFDSASPIVVKPHVLSHSVLPTGTVTFLFTDIEGSTDRWERLRDAMARALQRHNQLLHAAVSANKGSVFKTVGDAFCVAFNSAHEALAAAVAGQRAIWAEDWEQFDPGLAPLQVRMGLHTGDAVPCDDDYFGPDVNRVARVASAGHGGQILLSQTTHDIVLGAPGDGWTLRSLGTHHLKDLQYPMRIHQVVVDGLPDVTTPLATIRRSGDAAANRLPDLSAELFEQVGQNRRATLDLLLASIEIRSVTRIIGVGGVGKTSLVLAAVKMRPDGVREPLWINCEELPDATLDALLERIAAYLDWDDPDAAWKNERSAGISDVLRLADRLVDEPRIWLVIDALEVWLDNERQFRDPNVGELFKGLAARTHNARLIVITRVLPVLVGDKVPGGTFGKADIELAGLERTDGIALLRQSIPQAPQDDDQLGGLVDRFGGHPQALSLLAGQRQGLYLIRLLSEATTEPPDSDAGLAEFARRVLSRLRDQDRDLLRNLAVFRGPQPLDVFEHLLGDLNVARVTLDRLADENLLVVEHRQPVACFRLHPAVREAALADLGAGRPAAHLSAYKFYSSLTLDPEDDGPGAFYTVIEAHHHALRADALHLAVAEVLDNDLPERLQRWGEDDQLSDLARRTFGHLRGKSDWIAVIAAAGYAGLDAAASGNEGAARRCRQLGICARQLGELQPAARILEHGAALLAVLRESGDAPARHESARLYGELAVVLQRMGERTEEALRWCELSLKMAADRGDSRARQDRASLHRSAALLLGTLGRHQQSLDHYERAKTIYLDDDMNMRAMDMVDMMGVELQRLDKFDEAIELHGQALENYATAGHRYGIASATLNLGTAEHLRSQLDAAQHAYESALALFGELAEGRGQMVSRLNLGEVHLDRGAAREARPLLQKAMKESKALKEGEYRPYIAYLLGRTYLQLKDWAVAREWLEQALALAEASDNRVVAQLVRRALEELDGGARRDQDGSI